MPDPEPVDGQPADDPAAGYQIHAAEFIKRRSHSIGMARATVWARSLRRGARVLELGAGAGVPVSQALLDAGVRLSALDASLTLVDEFRRRFPDVEVAWERVENSNLFGRQFEAVIAIGLVFLLEPAAQRELFCKVALALEPRGAFLFTAPLLAGSWTDVLTRRESVSLAGEAGYHAALEDAGFEVVAQYTDEGDNNYYDCRLRRGSLR